MASHKKRRQSTKTEKTQTHENGVNTEPIQKANEASSPSFSERFAFWQFVYQKTDQFKNLVYMRATVVIAVYAFLIPFQAKVLESYKTIHLRSLDLTFVVLAFHAMLCASISFLYAIRSMQPFDWVKKIRTLLGLGYDVDGKRNPREVLTAFPYILKMDADKFEALFTQINREEIGQEMAKGLYNLSHIVNERYSSLKTSYALLLLSVADTVGTVVLAFWRLQIP